MHRFPPMTRQFQMLRRIPLPSPCILSSYVAQICSPASSSTTHTSSKHAASGKVRKGFTENVHNTPLPSVSDRQLTAGKALSENYAPQPLPTREISYETLRAQYGFAAAHMHAAERAVTEPWRRLRKSKYIKETPRTSRHSFRGS